MCKNQYPFKILGSMCKMVVCNKQPLPCNNLFCLVENSSMDLVFIYQESLVHILNSKAEKDHPIFIINVIIFRKFHVFPGRLKDSMFVTAYDTVSNAVKYLRERQVHVNYNCFSLNSSSMGSNSLANCKHSLVSI